MMPGPDAIIACPSCKTLHRQHTLLSANTFDTVYYSDGKQISPMLPSFPAFTHCNECREFFWIKAASQIETHESLEGRKGEYVRELSLEEIAEAVEKQRWSTRGQEIHLRERFWWKANDRTREGGGMLEFEENLKVKHRSNMSLFRELLNQDDPDEALLMAEISRALEDYESADRLLKKVPLKLGNGIVSRFRSALNDQKNSGNPYSVFKL